MEYGWGRGIEFSEDLLEWVGGKRTKHVVAVILASNVEGGLQEGIYQHQ